MGFVVVFAMAAAWPAWPATKVTTFTVSVTIVGECTMATAAHGVEVRHGLSAINPAVRVGCTAGTPYGVVLARPHADNNDVAALLVSTDRLVATVWY